MSSTNELNSLKSIFHSPYKLENVISKTDFNFFIALARYINTGFQSQYNHTLIFQDLRTWLHVFKPLSKYKCGHQIHKGWKAPPTVYGGGKWSIRCRFEWPWRNPWTTHLDKKKCMADSGEVSLRILEEFFYITIIYCNLAIATHSKKMQSFWLSTRGLWPWFLESG